MATGTLAPVGHQQFFDTNGDPLASGTLETYLAGSSTPVATHSDVGLLTANPTTITLNAAGRPQVSGTEVALFLTPGISYKFILKNSAGTVIWTQDNIVAVPAGTVDLDVTGTAGENLTAGDAVYLSDGSGGRTTGRWYKADADLPYASASAIMVGMVPSAIALTESGSVRLGGRMTGLVGLTAGLAYYVSGTAGALTATAPGNARLVGVADSSTSLVMAPDPPSVVDPGVCQGRLTLTTAVPVTTADVTAAGTIYFTPYKGHKVSLYDGTRWTTFTFTERSLALTITSGTNYDVYLYDNAGTLTLELTAWTNDTTRATALTTQDGIFVKTGVLTRRYLGTIRASGSNTTEDSQAKRYVYNYYNRAIKPVGVREATNSWQYTTAAFQQANASAANQVDVVQGVAEDAIDLALTHHANNDSGGIGIQAAIGEDSATTATTGSQIATVTVTANFIYQLSASLTKVPAVGRHFYAWLERSTATGTTTWYGDNNTPTIIQSGLTGIWRC